MAFHIRDDATDAAVRRLAEFKNKGLTETVLEAVTNEYERAREATPLKERIAPLIAKLKGLPRTGRTIAQALAEDPPGTP